MSNNIFRPLIATPASDKRLSKKYGQEGAKARRENKPVTYFEELYKGSMMNSLVHKWWVQGWTNEDNSIKSVGDKH